MINSIERREKKKPNGFVEGLYVFRFQVDRIISRRMQKRLGEKAPTERKGPKEIIREKGGQVDEIKSEWWDVWEEGRQVLASDYVTTSIMSLMVVRVVVYLVGLSQNATDVLLIALTTMDGNNQKNVTRPASHD